MRSRIFGWPVEALKAILLSDESDIGGTRAGLGTERHH